MKPQGYSYIRFSSSSQGQGDSLSRQMRAAQDYCNKKGLKLSSKNYRDLGLSGFKETSRPSLDDMLEAITKNKTIKAGDYIILENLDRLSRRGIDHTQDIIKSILRCKVKIVCLHDNLELDHTSLDDLTATIRVAIAADLANKSSAYKSKRLQSAWDKKQRLASEQGIPKSTKTPAWLKLSDDRLSFEVIESKVKVILRIFSMADSGFGAGAIATKFNEEAVPTLVTEGSRIPKQWHISTIKKILTNGSVVGTFTPTKIQDGKRVTDLANTIEDYYPQVIDKALYHRVAQRRKSLDKSGGSIRAGKGRLNNLLQKVARCSCYQPMQYLNKGDGNNQKYLRCSAAAVGNCANKYLYSYAQIERAVLVLLQAVDITALFLAPEDKSSNLECIASLELEIEDLKAKLSAWVEHEDISTVADRMRAAERRILDIGKELLELESTQQAAQSVADQVEQYKALITKVLGTDDIADTRVRLNVLLRDKFMLSFSNDDRKSCFISTRSFHFKVTLANLRFPHTNTTEVYLNVEQSYPEFRVMRDNYGKLVTEFMHEDKFENPFIK